MSFGFAVFVFVSFCGYVKTLPSMVEHLYTELHTDRQNEKVFELFLKGKLKVLSLFSLEMNSLVEITFIRFGWRTTIVFQ